MFIVLSKNLMNILSPKSSAWDSLSASNRKIFYCVFINRTQGQRQMKNLTTLHHPRIPPGSVFHATSDER